MSWPVNARTSLMMDEAQSLYGATITATQGSPNIGVGASAGTHDGEGVIDVVGADLDAIVVAMRRVGFAAWHRTVAEGFTPHVHGVAVGEPDLSSAAADQVDDYFAGRNGLATNAPDDGPRAYVGVTWETYNGGNADGLHARVYRGEQLTSDLALLNGVYSGPADSAVRFRDDADTFTLTAGNTLAVFVFSRGDVGDIWSMANWRLNAAGHGTATVSEGFDDGYNGVVPAMTPLGLLAVDRDTFALTATLSQFTSADAGRLSDDGYAVVTIECLTGSIIIEWLCLQIEPPGGLLAVSSGDWSEWITPAEVATIDDKSFAFGPGLADPAGNIYGIDWDSVDAAQGVQDALGDARLNWDMQEWERSDPFGDSTKFYGGMEAYATRFTNPLGPENSRAHVILYLYLRAYKWADLPSFRAEPAGLDLLVVTGDGGEDPDNFTYQFQPGVDAQTLRWQTSDPVGEWAPAADPDPPVLDGASASLVVYQELGDWTLGYPSLDYIPTGLDVATWTEDVTPQVRDAPALLPNQDLYLYADSTYRSAGTYINPPDGGWNGGPITPISVAGRSWQIQISVALIVQMPPFRYWRQKWTRSPDALDTSDPEGVIVTWLRQRQRNDGLGNSVIRAKGSSSRQRSLRQRGYR